MRKKGFHMPGEDLGEGGCGCGGCNYAKVYHRSAYAVCDKCLIPWPDLPESRRQEYLTTAKAVLPEIVGEALDECIEICKVQADSCGETEEAATWRGCSLYIQDEIKLLRDRRLEELKK